MRLIDADRLKQNWLFRGDDGKPYREVIDAQPTIEERKTGRWKQISPAGIYECDLCGKNVMTRDIDAYDFCHGCGAKMEPKQTLSEADNDTTYGGLMSAT